jgi:molecular chaperone HtpG
MPKSALKNSETLSFEADVAKLLHMMVHSVYSDKDVFLRELISNAADACEKLRYEAVADPALLGDSPLQITISIDKDQQRLSVEDNGIGMSRADLVEHLGTIARSGTKAFMEKIEAAQKGEDASLIGQFGVGFYSAFMVATSVDVLTRRAGSSEAWKWTSDGKGSYTIAPLPLEDAPAHGTRVILHLTDDAKTYTETYRLETIIRNQSGHVPVPISLRETADAELKSLTDGAALWTRNKADISADDYKDFYHNVSGQYDDPVLTTHYRAEGRQEYTVLTFVPSSRPFDLFDTERKGRIKLYVKRVFITDDADILPRYLRFVRGLVDSSDLPLNVSREMIQESPVLTAIKRGVTSRVLSELEKCAENDHDTFKGIWDNFGPVIKEGLYEDFERRDALLKLVRFRTTASSAQDRTLKAYVEGLKENQTAIYYLVGDDAKRLEASPHLEGFKARGIEVLLLTDPVDSFWVTSGLSYEGKPLKSVTQGAADLSLIPLLEPKKEETPESAKETADLVVLFKDTLGDAVSDVRVSDRLTESAVCLVAADQGLDRQLEKILAGAGRLPQATKPILEINADHVLIRSLLKQGAAKPQLRQDAIHLLFAEALILDGARPDDPRSFSEQLSRVLSAGFGG